MTILAADWSIDRATGNHRYIGDDHGGASPSYGTVIEDHRYLQALADDLLAVGDDDWDIVAPNPSARSTDNIITFLNNVNIDDNASEHLYDGSIIQNGGADIYDGFVNFGNTPNIQIHQNGSVLADDWWNSNGGLNPDPVQGISHRFMLKTRSGGADIDLRKILGTTRNANKTYAEFPVNGTSRGNNVLALSESDNLNNATALATIATWNTITNTIEGYNGIDANNDGVDENYYSAWDKDIYTINQLYERAAWIQTEGSTETIYGLNGELFRGITHELDVDGGTGTFAAFEPVSWAGGTGQMLAIDDPTAPTKMYIQLLTGNVPADNDVITGGTSSATATLNINVQSVAVEFPFIGASTGTSIIGAYGVGIQVDDLTAADKVKDLTGATIIPPNFVTYSVNGLVIGEDTVHVAPWDGVSTDVEGNPEPDFDQMSVTTTLSVAAEVAVVVNAIPADTPNTGTIRVQLDDGRYRRVPYLSYTGNTFTIAATDFTAFVSTQPKNAYVSYIDKVATAPTETFTSVYDLDRNLVAIVRDGGGTPIKEFISPSSLTSAGGSITAIRTSDA